MAEEEVKIEVNEEALDTVVDPKAQWQKMTVVQLKGALTMRGIDTDGKKSQLVERLAEYEENKAKEEERKANEATDTNGEAEETMDTEDKTEEQEKEKPDPFFLPRGKFLNAYRGAASLMTVLVSPFEKEFFASECFLEHITKAKTFQLKKLWNDTSGAELRFMTIGEGEAAFVAMKNQLASIDVDVYHPGFRTNYNITSCKNHEFRTIFEGMEEDEDANEEWIERFIILDNLPDEMTDTKLAEAIPEAIEVVDIGLFEESEGCMVVSFSNKKARAEWIEKNAQFKLDGKLARVLPYILREKHANQTRNRLGREKRLKEKAEGKTEEEVKKMSNEDRLEKVKRWNYLLTSRNVLQDRDDIQGYAKLQEDKSVTEEMTNHARDLLVDAKLKIADKEKLPESVEQMTAPIKKLVQGDVVRKPLPHKSTLKITVRNDEKGKVVEHQSSNQTKPWHKAGQIKSGYQGLKKKTWGNKVQQQTGYRGNQGYQANRGNQQKPWQNPANKGDFQSKPQNPKWASPRLQTSPRVQTRPQNKFQNRDQKPMAGMNRKRPMINPVPINRLQDQGSYYDDAPSKKKVRNQSPYRQPSIGGGGGMSGTMGAQATGGYYQAQAQEQQIQGLTSMLSKKKKVPTATQR